MAERAALASPFAGDLTPATDASVLVVDDDDAVATTLASLLERSGYVVDVCGSRAASVDRLRRGRVDALVADLHLETPNDGLELVRAAKQHDEDVVAIVLTGFLSAESARQAVQLGAWAYLTKPCDPSELLLALVRGLAHRRQLRQLRARAEAAEAAAAAARTAQREAEQARDWLRTVIEVMPEGVAIADASGRLMRTNSAAHASWGTASSSTADHPAFDYARADGAPFDKDELPLGRALNGGVVNGQEVQVLNRTSGLVRTLLISAAPVRHPDGSLGGAVSVCQDVTALRLVREEAVRARQQLEAILTRIAEGVIVRDATGHIVFANDAAARALRLDDPAAVLGTPRPALHERFSIVDELGSSLPWDQLPGERALAGEDGAEATVGFRYLDSREERWSFISAQPIRDASGEVVMEVSVFHDITDLKRAERSQRFLAGASRQLSASLDVKATLDVVARLAVPEIADWCVVSLATDDGQIRPIAIAHTDPAKESLAWQMAERYPSSPDAPHGVPLVFRTGQAVLLPDIPEELYLASASDAEHEALLRHLFSCSAMIVPIRAAGRTLGVLSLLSAESGRHFAAADLKLAEDFAQRASLAIENAQLYDSERSARAAAQHAVRLRDEFIASAAHELKTPLTSLHGRIQQLLRRPDVPAQLQSVLAVADDQAQYLGGLIQRLFDIASLEAGELQLHKSRFELAAALERAASAFHSVSTQRITIHGPSELLVVADERRLAQVVVSLLDNARRFNVPRQPIEVTFGSDAPASVFISVRDHGPGVPAEAQDRIFQGRLTTSADEPAAGLGLGLHFSRAIVELHGGSIELTSPADGGACFTLRLPATSPAAPLRPENPAHAPRSGYILVVDDDSQIRELVAAVLADEGYAVRVAVNGSHALEMVTEPPALILLDIRMPVMNGEQFMAAYRARVQAPAPVVVMTAAADSVAVAQGLDAAGHLAKPFELSELLETVGRWVER
ncbi:MAG: response regulator [Chloroflexi bacterium]|nr:response regulator [Chloroflexota bacterium]